MPITILDYVTSIVGDKPAYPAEDFYSHGVAMLGGCQCCYAMLGGYNAYPSKSGYWRCAHCIGDTGFATTAEFTHALRNARREDGNSAEECEPYGEVGEP